MENRVDEWTDVPPVPVAHIADYYDRRWEMHKCLAWQLLRRGYRQLSKGRIESCNNLFSTAALAPPSDMCAPQKPLDNP